MSDERVPGDDAPPDPEVFPATLLEGAHVVVTGGGSGLGRSIARRCAAVGAHVGVIGRRRGRLDETVALVTAAGGTAAAASADIKHADAVDAALAALEDHNGPVTHLVNNAAGNFLALTETITERGFDAVVGTNLYGSFHATTACGRRWIERGRGGTVLSISTTYAASGSAYLVPSAVSKAGIEALTRSLAVEWGRHGIRLNGIAPGPIPTEGAWKRLVPDDALEEDLRARIPLGRFGTRDDLTHLALFLLSDLSAYITGQIVSMDGGEHLATGGWFNEMARRPKQELAAMFAAMRPPSRDTPGPTGTPGPAGDEPDGS